MPRTAARGLSRTLDLAGELLITFAVLLGLYLVYTLWWTNVAAGITVRADSAALQRTLAAAPGPAPRAAPGSAPGSAPAAAHGVPADGTGFGFLYIPALGPGWRALITQGVERDLVLNTGAVGHYSNPATAMPWDGNGNFALAGHRDGHGMIFRDLDLLHAGDRVYVQTLYGWFVYRLDREAPSVPIDDVAALDPVPAGSGYTAPGRYLTLTTCTPMYVDSNRLVWWGHLVSSTPRGVVPPGVEVDS